MSGTRTFETLDYHTAGEPLRIVTAGLPDIDGDTMIAKRRQMQASHDDVRRLLMLEPRGHADMYGAVITGPVNPESDCGVLFMHNEGYSTMCGHGVIALATAISEHGLVPVAERDRVRIDTPAGLIEARIHREDGSTPAVSFVNVPSFVQQVIGSVPFRGRVLDVTLAFGGAWYAYVDALEAGIRIVPENALELSLAGRELKRIVRGLAQPFHPEGGEDLNFLYGVIFVERGAQVHESRNACVFAEGELDRSPTGTGVSGRAAIHYANGEVGLNEKMVVASILGTTFEVECVSETRVGDIPAVVTRVTGKAHMTGRHAFYISDGDPLHRGFLLR